MNPGLDGLVGMPALLREWLPRQRWFAGKGRGVRDVRLVTAAELVTGDPSLFHVVAAVRYEDAGESGPEGEVRPGGAEEYYQLLIGSRLHLPPRLTHCALGVLGAGPLTGRTVYDAAYDADLTGWFLDHSTIAPATFAPTGDGLEVGAPAPHRGGEPDREADAALPPTGPLRFHRVPGAELPRGLASLVIGVEQSNTSMVFGDQIIMKLFRRLNPGINPDLEVSLALAEAGSDRVAEPLAWIESDLAETPTTFAILHRYLPTATGGWELALTSVRDLYADPWLEPEQAGGDFAGESYRLGIATAEVHADLARSLPSAVMGAAELHELASAMRSRLAHAVASVPQLEPYSSELGATYDELVGHPGPVRVQRIHGDYHLGQVIRTTAGWVLLDFEGEPARPLGERRALHSPMRDVAAMLRSFDYAARHLLAERPGEQGLEDRARAWAERNREAFCEGYAKASGTDPREDDLLLRAFETDKAVYETVYEAHNRPSWLPIPMAAVHRLARTHAGHSGGPDGDPV